MPTPGFSDEEGAITTMTDTVYNVTLRAGLAHLVSFGDASPRISTPKDLLDIHGCWTKNQKRHRPMCSKPFGVDRHPNSARRDETLTAHPAITANFVWTSTRVGLVSNRYSASLALFGNGPTIKLSNSWTCYVSEARRGL